MKFRKIGVAVTPVDTTLPSIGVQAPPMQPTTPSTTTTPSTPPTSGFGTSASNHNHKIKDNLPKFIKYAPK